MEMGSLFETIKSLCMIGAPQFQAVLHRACFSPRPKGST
jgi:hypothetical protein